MSADTRLPRCVFLDVGSVGSDDLDLSSMRDVAELSLRHNTAPDELDGALAGAEVVISNKVVLDGDTLRRNPHIRFIAIAATGTNNLDLATARELGMQASNVTAYATASVVQHVFALVLNLQTRLLEYRHSVQQGDWCAQPFFSLLTYPFQELAGKVLGIVGYGELGRAVADVARAFGMQVLLAKRNPQDDRDDRLDLHDLLPRVDVLSLHCPLTPDNRHLIGATELGLMKTGALLINTARGPLVDEAALLAALQQGDIGGAGLDVLSQEPPPADMPLLQYREPNLIVTPHVAWASRESRQRLVDQLALNIQAYTRGQVRNPVY